MAKIQLPARAANPAKRGLGPDADAIRLALTDRAEALFRLAWGEPARPGAREWRARATSARSMVMRGAKRGLWHDHASGEGGDALDFVATHICGLARARDDFPRVLREAAAFCGMGEGEPLDLAVLHARKAAQKAKDERQEAAEAERKAALVRALQARAEPIKGSPAAAYLAGRGICEPPAGWSFLPPVPDLPVPSSQYPALVAWAVDASGRITGGQRILIRDDGSKAPENPRKPAFGAIGGYPARIAPRAPGGPICVCEGPETAAAVALATGFEAWAVFGASGFASAPVPAGRRIVLCPDRDAPGSPAAAAFAKACDSLAAHGADLWIAAAPEPEGSKRDLADTLAGQGAAAVATAIERAVKFTRRDKRGHFTGKGAFATDEPVTLPDFLSPDEARRRIRAAVIAFLADCAAWAAAGKKGPAPVLAIACSPGSGKSTIARQVLAEFDLTALGKGDAIFFTPTLALADAAAAHAKSLKTGSHVTRGRLANLPGGDGEKMCARPELAEKVAGAGLHVQPTLCERINENGAKVRCPFFKECDYQAQWIPLSEGPELRFESHAYLPLHDDGSNRDTGLRIIDETIWRQFVKIVDVPLDVWLRRREPMAGRRPVKGRSKEQERLRAHDLADSATEGAKDVLHALQMGQSPLALAIPAEEYEALAEAEMPANTLAPTPSAPDDRIADALAEHIARFDGATERAEIWKLLADAKGRGLRNTERLQLIHGVVPPGGGEPRSVLRVTRLLDPPDDAPVLILDADAEPEIVQRLFPQAEVVSFEMRPNAQVIQLTDKTFSKATTIPREGKPLNGAGNRKAIVDLIRAEVHRDRLQGNRGVLVVATKALVRQLFVDAGYIFDGLDKSEVDGLMQSRPLHGARWIWYGPASLGQNTWERFGTAVVIGREELPLASLEDYGRAVFGDTGSPLQMVQPDEKTGRRILPRSHLPVTMSDGSGVALEAAAHPDERIFLLQKQGREWATRQAIERLRLGLATQRKRVVVASAVPIPGLPVDELATWQELAPNRLQAAMAEAAQAGGVLRLSAAGLAADAPETFASANAAKFWMKREGLALLKGITPLIGISISGVIPFNPAKVKYRCEGQAGQLTRALVVLPGDPRSLVEAQHGPLADFKLVDAGSLNAANTG